jgi:hypothetical protein
MVPAPTTAILRMPTPTPPKARDSSGILVENPDAMRVAGWILLLSTLALLAATLALLSAAGRLYRAGHPEASGTGARGMGVLTLSLGLGVLAAGSGVATVGPTRPWLGWVGLVLFALASIAGGLGFLSRKPLPSAQVAWALYMAGSVVLAAAVLL